MHNWLACPPTHLELTPFVAAPESCPVAEAIFALRSHTLFGSVYEVRPIQVHAMVLAVFASTVAPFGGFFASGFKRAFDLKDFSPIIPG